MYINLFCRTPKGGCPNMGHKVHGLKGGLSYSINKKNKPERLNQILCYTNIGEYCPLTESTSTFLSVIFCLSLLGNAPVVRLA